MWGKYKQHNTSFGLFFLKKWWSMQLKWLFLKEPPTVQAPSCATYFRDATNSKTLISEQKSKQNHCSHELNSRHVKFHPFCWQGSTEHEYGIFMYFFLPVIYVNKFASKTSLYLFPEELLKYFNTFPCAAIFNYFKSRNAYSVIFFFMDFWSLGRLCCHFESSWHAFLQLFNLHTYLNA